MNRDHRRPPGVSDDKVEAAGEVSEAFEWIERARGRLFDFHQMVGKADLLLGDAADMLDSADCRALADLLRKEIIGRNVLEGRWTFQVVEEFDDGYYRPVVAAEEEIRNELLEGRRHVYEAEMKERRRTSGRQGHESEPPTRAATSG